MVLEGDTAIIGAPSDEFAGLLSGTAHVLVCNGTVWSQQARLQASGPAYADIFGGDLALLDDTVLIGAPGKSSESGAVHVFVRSGGSWTQQAKLTASNAAPFSHFGSVCIDDDIALIGASGDDQWGTDSGAVCCFRRWGSAWIQETKFAPNNVASGDTFGSSLSFFGDTVLMAAAWDDHENGSGRNEGTVRSFGRTAPASAILRNYGANPASYDTVTLPILGSTSPPTSTSPARPATPSPGLWVSPRRSH